MNDRALRLAFLLGIVLAIFVGGLSAPYGWFPVP